LLSRWYTRKVYLDKFSGCVPQEELRHDVRNSLSGLQFYTAVSLFPMPLAAYVSTCYRIGNVKSSSDSSWLPEFCRGWRVGEGFGHGDGQFVLHRARLSLIIQFYGRLFFIEVSTWDVRLTVLVYDICSTRVASRCSSASSQCGSTLCAVCSLCLR